MLSDRVNDRDAERLHDRRGLNAPYGARCFLTIVCEKSEAELSVRLNVPYGARCFLTVCIGRIRHDSRLDVLMHLMALGAF